MKLVTIKQAAELTGRTIRFFRHEVETGRLATVPRPDGMKNPHLFDVRDIRRAAKRPVGIGRPKKARPAK